jgi:hypothetical protein
MTNETHISLFHLVLVSLGQSSVFLFPVWAAEQGAAKVHVLDRSL